MNFVKVTNAKPKRKLYDEIFKIIQVLGLEF